ncbi:growth-regulated alpha protein, partial [Salmo salar]|uniref:Growth-regulated alpha protein n=1 Tax=Salmo salar TaxID=8030 RepID=A0A1S3SDZ1_SALSA
LIVLGMHPIGRDYNRQCLCNQLESRQSVEILPRGPRCKTTEVIAGLVSGEKICLNPHSGWVKKLARFAVKRQSERINL